LSCRGAITGRRYFRESLPHLGSAAVADHAAERMFVDYAGATLAVIDSSTGAARTAQLFVAVLGASNYTYAEATWTQGLSDWIGPHTRSFASFGGVPRWWCPSGRGL
jgi:transposase